MNKLNLKIATRIIKLTKDFEVQALSLLLHFCTILWQMIQGN